MPKSAEISLLNLHCVTGAARSTTLHSVLRNGVSASTWLHRIASLYLAILRLGSRQRSVASRNCCARIGGHRAAAPMGQELSSDASLTGEAYDTDGDEGGHRAGGVDVQSLDGYRVMKVFKGSPASRAGLAAFEDFIVAVDGALVNGDGALGGILQAAEGSAVSLTVWNCIDMQERCVNMTPAKWTGGPGLLGAAVRYEPVKGATEFIWHVVDVYRNSPADEAGLTPQSDYLVGTTSQVFRRQDALSKLIRDCAKAKVAAGLLVYSTSTARTRCIDIRPTSEWDGDGLLGCELATGLLHRITRSDPH